MPTSDRCSSSAPDSICHIPTTPPLQQAQWRCCNSQHTPPALANLSPSTPPGRSPPEFLLPITPAHYDPSTRGSSLIDCLTGRLAQSVLLEAPLKAFALTAEAPGRRLSPAGPAVQQATAQSTLPRQFSKVGTADADEASLDRYRAAVIREITALQRGLAPSAELEVVRNDHRRAVVISERHRGRESQGVSSRQAVEPLPGSKREAGPENARVEASLLPGLKRSQNVADDEPVTILIQHGGADQVSYASTTPILPTLPPSLLPSPLTPPLDVDSDPTTSPPPAFPPYGDTPPTSPNRLIIRSSAYYRVPPPTPICLSRPSSPVLGLGHALRPAIIDTHCAMDPWRCETLGPALILDGDGDTEDWDGVLH